MKLYKRKQIYWVDTVYGSKRIKESTGFKSKAKAEEYVANLFKRLMIEERLGKKGALSRNTDSMGIL